MYHQRVGDLTAYILAGGGSTRMGRDKALLELHGRTLLDRALSLASSVTSAVHMVGSKKEFGTVAQTIEDIIPNCGPLGGIHAALTHTTTELNLILALDIPFIEPEFLAFLISQASQTNALVTVPRAGGGWQPLCAVYRRAFVQIAERALKEGSYKIDTLFADAETRVVSEEEMTRMGFSPLMFRNLNTPQEFEEAEKACGS